MSKMILTRQELFLLQQLAQSHAALKHYASKAKMYGTDRSHLAEKISVILTVVRQRVN